VVVEIILVEPRGFCSGVRRAIRKVNDALNNSDNVFIRHDIVHNNHVVADIEKRGGKFVRSLSEIPNYGCVVLSAHGTPPSVKLRAKESKLEVIDAVCPLVTKIHNKAMELNKKGYSIVLIGKKGHQEVLGTTGYAPMIVIQNKDEIEDLSLSGKVAVLTQTTLNAEKINLVVDILKQKYLDLLYEDDCICYATSNRQNAIKKVAPLVDLVIVIGSKKSSNSNELVKTAKLKGTNAYLIDDYTELKDEWFENVNSLAISSGASAPEVLVKDLVHHLKEKFPGAIIK